MAFVTRGKAGRKAGRSTGEVSRDSDRRRGGGRGGTRARGGGGPTRGAFYSKATLQSLQQLIEMKAARLLGCETRELIVFVREEDFCNPGHILSGVSCRAYGHHYGALLITHVDDQEMSSPLYVHGLPPMSTPQEAVDAGLRDAFAIEPSEGGGDAGEHGTDRSRSRSRVAVSSTHELLGCDETKPSLALPSLLKHTDLERKLISSTADHSTGPSGSSNDSSSSASASASTASAAVASAAAASAAASAASTTTTASSSFSSTPSSSSSVPRLVCSHLLVSTKWNGQLVQVFKYRTPHGSECASMRARLGGPLRPSKSNPLLQQACTVLGVPFRVPPRGTDPALQPPLLPLDALPSILHPLQHSAVQSLSLELCGQDLPGLVFYPSTLQAIPLLFTAHDGTIFPFLQHTPVCCVQLEQPEFTPPCNKPTHRALFHKILSRGGGGGGATSELLCISEAPLVTNGLYHLDASLSMLDHLLLSVRQEDLLLNQAFREETRSPAVRWYSHFAREGRVFAFLQPAHAKYASFAALQGAPAADRRAYCVTPNPGGSALLWKVKPSDFDENAKRFPAWSSDVQLLALESRRRLMERGLEGDDIVALFAELRWPRQVMGSYRNQLRTLLSNLPTLSEQEAAAAYLAPLAHVGESLSARMPPPNDANLSSSGSATPLLVLVLVSMPGAGKSTLANRLLAVAPHRWSRVNQDEMGSRKTCITRAKDALAANRHVIVDRCNFDVEQRKSWIELAIQHQSRTGTPVYCAAVYLDVPVEVCMARVGVRTDHPTLPPSEKSQEIVSRFSSMLCKPHAAEGFGVVVSLASEHLDELLAQLARFPIPSLSTSSAAESTSSIASATN